MYAIQKMLVYTKNAQYKYKKNTKNARVIKQNNNIIYIQKMI